MNIKGFKRFNQSDGGSGKKKKFSAYKLLLKISAYMAIFGYVQYIIIFVLMLLFLFISGACILNFFQKPEDDILEKYQINWSDYNCTCTFLSQEDIDKVKAGGTVAVTPNNSGSLNVSGGAVDSNRGLSGYTFAGYPMEYFVLSVSSELGISDSQIKTMSSHWDGYNAYGPNQMDRHYHLAPLMTHCYSRHPNVWTVFAQYQGLPSRLDDSYKSTGSNGSIIKQHMIDVYTNNTDIFVDDYFSYVYDHFVAPPIKDAKEAGFDLESRHAAVVSVAVSCSVFAGSGKWLFNGVSANMTDEEIINRFYANTRVKKPAKQLPGERWCAPGGKGENDYALDWIHGTFNPATTNSPSYVINYSTGWDYTNAIRIATGKPGGSSTSQTNTTTSFGTSGSGQAVDNGNVIPGLTASQSANANQVYSILNELGYSSGSALGIMGNMWQETHFEPNLWGPGSKKGKWADSLSTYYTVTQTNKSAIPQWISYLSTIGSDIDTIDGQVRGLNWTMSEGPEKGLFNTYPDGDYKITLEQFKGLTDPILACDYFMVAYERATGGTDESVTGKSTNRYQHLKQRKEFTETLMTHFGVSAESGSTSVGGVSGTDSLKYSDKEQIGLDSSWIYANESKINTGKSVYYRATGTPKNICIAVNAGHGCSGGNSVQTKSHPDGTAKVTGGTTAAGAIYSTAISSGMEFNDHVSEATANLKVANAMRDSLLAKGYDVLMIRDSDDTQLDNIARTVIANNIADAHVAIHFDSTTSDKGAFYMSVPNVSSYREMEPVKSIWQQHNALGEALLVGLVNNGVKKYSSGSMEMDLTQTSYSTIPSVDIELGDHNTPHGDAECVTFGKGLSDGIDEYFKTATPVNQGKRGSVQVGGGAGTNASGASGGTGSSGGSTRGVVNKNPNNLRTQCRMGVEGICGCYISDPSCMCHVFGGDDGVLGTDDDKFGATDSENGEGGQATGGANLSGLTPEQAKVIEGCRVAMDAYMEAMKERVPTNYESGWIWVDGQSFPVNEGLAHNPWYGQKGGKTVYWSMKPIINGKQYSGARSDCSSYASGVLTYLGAEWSGVANGSGSFTADGDVGKAARRDDRFIVIEGGNIKSQVQPGDIVRREGHVEICYQVVDASQNLFKVYSWGSTGSVRNCYDATTRQLLPEPITVSSSHYDKATTIIRYVGSGGAGR